MDVLAFITEAKSYHERSSRARIPPQLRQQYPIAFLDLRKALDTVSRAKLLQKMVNKGINTGLVRAIRDLLTNTRMHIDDQKFTTYRGVPQGAVTSPFLFNFFIDDLLFELNTMARVKAYAFADDIVICCESTEVAVRAILKADTWCLIND